MDEIFRDLYKFVKDFPVSIIPHMTEEEHIYMKDHGGKLPYVNSKDVHHYGKTSLNYHHVKQTFDEIYSDRVARLIGLVSHFSYWVVFGHVNQLPLDNYHLKQLFVSVAQL